MPHAVSSERVEMRADMEVEHFNRSLLLAARLVEQKEYDDALTAMRPLMECELSELDKAIVCVNMAIVCGIKGEATDAMAWYDRGINCEQPHGRFFVAEQKAAYLAEMGWTADSLMLYQKLLSEPSLTDKDRARIEQNIALLQTRLG
jgi:hypothetical protein